MIGISKLYCNDSFAHDPLRYGEKAQAGTLQPHHRAQSAKERRPVVVWNLTRTCNLRCIHCYTESESKLYPNELSTEEALKVIDDLAAYKIPSLLLSGGEPLLRHDFWQLLRATQKVGLRTVLSTNATLIKPDVAEKLKEHGLIYVGASLDGIGEVHNKFRGQPWAYDKAVKGIRNCKKAGIKISLRITLTRHNVNELDRYFKFIENEDIDRICFYHLAYSGRGRKLVSEDLSAEETRAALDKILLKSKDLHDRGFKKDILTVANHADGVYLYLKLLKTDPQRAEKVKELLAWNGGGANSSGVGVANINFLGNVHADQFWQTLPFGNVKERPFSEIWEDTSHPVMAGLKNRLPLLEGRCQKCQWQSLCGGSLRVRAYSLNGNPWAEDPACYLTDEEIGFKQAEALSEQSS